MEAFLPKAAVYARERNHDRAHHGDVSRLSPYLRHRLVDESEVIDAVSTVHGAREEKFIQEIFWRTYWKGWLEMRPSVWSRYQAQRDADLRTLDRDRRMRADYEAAVEGRVGIRCFDAWAQELVQSGYMHNHARMWFASIWIYTLKLPWSLGADFFYRHLLDGDPASNTLSWRWVCGLQTRGKTYLARRDNIRKYTEGRFDPVGLANEAPPLEEEELPAADRARIPQDAYVDLRGRSCGRPPKAIRLLHGEDLASGAPLGPCVVALGEPLRSPLGTSAAPRSFLRAACEHTADRNGGEVCELDALFERLRKEPAVVAPYACTGPLADALHALGARLEDAGVPFVRRTRTYDRTSWPHATRGFFALRKKIPRILEAGAAA